MKRIIYLSPYAADCITGGIKVMFRHVEMLCQLGFDACVYAPAGRPPWLATDAPLFSGRDLLSNPRHILVFPELLNGDLCKWALADIAASKVMLCQNQYYSFSEALQAKPLHELDFIKLVTVGQVARGFLDRVFAPAVFDVAPVWIDGALFHPRAKTPSIAVFPRKLPQVYDMLRRIFVAKYPQLRDTPWRLIHKLPERRAAEILGEATVFLSLCDRECCPLSALEAMSSGCAVAGFHGYGGLEYATAENGIWLPPDHLEETVDALASLLIADQEGDARIARYRENGFETARGFNKERTKVELARIYAPLCKPSVLQELDGWLQQI